MQISEQSFIIFKHSYEIICWCITNFLSLCYLIYNYQKLNIIRSGLSPYSDNRTDIGSDERIPQGILSSTPFIYRIQLRGGLCATLQRPGDGCHKRPDSLAQLKSGM